MYLRVIITPLHLSAISMTIFRLGYRYKTRQYYWDDLWAICALTADLGLFLSILIWPISHAAGSYIDYEISTVRIWVAALLLPCAVWSSRISVAFSIYRIAERDMIRKRCVIVLICVFILIWLTVMVLEAIDCSLLDPDKPIPICLGSKEQLFFTALAILCDVCLVFIPLHMLRGLRLSKTDRFLVRTVFSASVLSSIAAIVRTVCNLVDSPVNFRAMFAIELASQLRGVVALIVCNLNVVMPCIYRLFRNPERDDTMSLSIHIDLSPARVSPARTSVADRLIPLQNVAEQAIVREPRSQEHVAQLASRTSSGPFRDSNRPLSELPPVLDVENAR